MRAKSPTVESREPSAECLRRAWPSTFDPRPSTIGLALWILLALVLLLSCSIPAAWSQTATVVNNLPRTTTLSPTNIFVVLQSPNQTNGLKGISGSNLVEGLKTFPNWTAAGQGATNNSATNSSKFGLFDQLSGGVFRFFGLEQGSNSVLYFNGSNVVVNSSASGAGGGNFILTQDGFGTNTTLYGARLSTNSYGTNFTAVGWLVVGGNVTNVGTITNTGIMYGETMSSLLYSFIQVASGSNAASGRFLAFGEDNTWDSVILEQGESQTDGFPLVIHNSAIDLARHLNVSNHVTIKSNLIVRGGQTNQGAVGIAGGLYANNLTIADYAQIGQDVIIGNSVAVDGEGQFNGPFAIKTIKFITGTGSPEGAATADVQSLYFQTNQTSAIGLWLKTNGVGNTGWWPLTPGAGGAGEANVNGEVSVTNATRFGLVNSKAGVTNLLRSIEPKYGLKGTNEGGTNISLAIDPAVVASQPDLTSSSNFVFAWATAVSNLVNTKQHGSADLTNWTDTATVEASGQVTIGGRVLPAANNSYDLGTSGAIWNDIFANTLSANQLVESFAEIIAGTYLRASNQVITPLLQVAAVSNDTKTVGSNLHVNGTNATWRYVGHIDATIVYTNLQLNTPVDLEILPTNAGLTAGWAITFNVPAAAWPDGEAPTISTNGGPTIIRLVKVSSTQTNAWLVSTPSFSFQPGWGLSAITNFITRTVTTVATNRPAGIATNATSVTVGFSDAENVQIYNAWFHLTTNLVVSPTNLIVGRTICVRFDTNALTYDVVVTNTAANRVNWNFNVSTNGSTSFTKTNTMRARLYLTAETNGVLSAELGYYR
jgi:hypothetical protein